MDYAQSLVEAQNLADYGTALPTAEQIKKRKGGLSAAAALVKARMKKAWLKKNPNGTDAEWEKIDAANLAAWKVAHPLNKPVKPAAPVPVVDEKKKWMRSHSGATEAAYAAWLLRKKLRDKKKKAGGS